MNCPACQSGLSKKNTATATFHYCPACKGTWFDKESLKKFDEPHEPMPPEIDVPAGSAKPADYSEGARRCPQCPEAVMCRRWYDVHRQVEVDQCLSCSGIFLDGGELAAIRAQYQTEEERLKAEDEWLGVHLKEVEEDIEDNIATERARIAVNKRTVQYRFFKALSDLLGADAF